ncbi:MAG: hypothetical protein FWF86_04130 [Clostridia bacterium]|nr:hypothetical protein [Clostridia bacterium]
MILLAAALLAVFVLVLLSNISMNRRLEVTAVKVPAMALDRSFENLTVLHISDLHADPMGHDMNIWRTALYGKGYSAAVLTGDMVGKTGDYQPLVSLINILRQINAAAPIYFIAGDDDPPPVISAYRGTPEVLADWVLAAQGAGALYLDAPMSQQSDKRTVWFVPEVLYSMDVAGMAESLARQKADMETLGKQYEADGGASYRALCNRLDAMERSADAIKAMTPQDLQIAVSHAPLDVEYVRMAVEWAEPKAVFGFRSVALVLAGHFVAGQWRLPGIGPVYVPETGWFPGDEGIVGMQRINSVNQYTSGGVGASSFYPMPGRLFNAPSAALLSFTARIE